MRCNFEANASTFSELCDEQGSRSQAKISALYSRVEEVSDKKAEHIEVTKTALQTVIENSLSTSVRNLSMHLNKTEHQLRSDVSIEVDLTDCYYYAIIFDCHSHSHLWYLWPFVIYSYSWRKNSLTVIKLNILTVTLFGIYFTLVYETFNVKFLLNVSISLSLTKCLTHMFTVQPYTCVYCIRPKFFWWFNLTSTFKKRKIIHIFFITYKAQFPV